MAGRGEDGARSGNEVKGSGTECRAGGLRRVGTVGGEEEVTTEL